MELRKKRWKLEKKEMFLMGMVSKKRTQSTSQRDLYSNSSRLPRSLRGKKWDQSRTYLLNHPRRITRKQTVSTYKLHGRTVRRTRIFCNGSFARRVIQKPSEKCRRD